MFFFFKINLYFSKKKTFSNYKKKVVKCNPTLYIFLIPIGTDLGQEQTDTFKRLCVKNIDFTGEGPLNTGINVFHN